jgi:hypothetical protein
MSKYSPDDGEPDRYASGVSLCVPCCATPARRPGFDTRKSKSLIEYWRVLKSNYASIANCKASRDIPDAVTAKSPCATRVIKFVLLFMCAYSLTDRTDNRMRRPPMHNKRTI